MDAINIFASLTNEFLFVFLFDGIAFLTIGVIVIGRLQVEGDKGHLHVRTREHERIHGFGAKF